jgi:hypothetical protein
MKKSNELQALNEAIVLLQIKRSREFILLRDQFHLTYESLKPLNLIKHTFKEAASATEIKEGVVNSAIGLATGYFTKAVVIGSTTNPLKKILGALLQFTVATLVSRNSESIKTIGKIVVDKIYKTTMEVDQKLSDNGNGMISNTVKY